MGTHHLQYLQRCPLTIVNALCSGVGRRARQKALRSTFCEKTNNNYVRIVMKYVYVIW